MKHLLPLIIFLLFLCGCGDNTSAKITASLSAYTRQNNKELNSFRIDSINYSLTDSTAYFNHYLHSLEEKSESFSKMAKLRTNMAQSSLNKFLSIDKKDDHLDERNKLAVDKSLEALKQNEREWNAINDSMDMMLEAVHTTDTLKKVFYNVRFSLHARIENKSIILSRKAIINRDDFKVVFVE